MNRRLFNQSLVALNTITLGSSVAAAPAEGRALHLVSDARLAALDSLRVSAWTGPLYRHTFDGDVSRLWLEVLRGVWRDGHCATAGFTRHTEFFLLSTLAAEHGYRVAATDEGVQYLSWLLVRDRDSHREFFEQHLPV